MGKIFYIMGKSSSGKDTVFRELLKKQTWNLKKIVLYTTRPPRTDEIDGIDYFFVNEEILKDMERAGQVIEVRSYHTVYGVWKYFTADSEQIDLKRNSYLAIGTLESYQKMKSYFGETRIVPVYIEVEDGERLLRAVDREKKQEVPKYEELCRRFLADSKDFDEEKLKSAGIKRRFSNNSTLERCVEEILQYIAEEEKLVF